MTSHCGAVAESSPQLRLFRVARPRPRSRVAYCAVEALIASCSFSSSATLARDGAGEAVRNALLLLGCASCLAQRPLLFAHLDGPVLNLTANAQICKMKSLNSQAMGAAESQRTIECPIPTTKPLPPSAKDRKASESDPPRKKRKVNTACVYCRRSVRRFLLQIVSALPNLDRRARNIMG